MHYMKKQFLRNIIYLYYILNHMKRIYHRITAFIDNERCFIAFSGDMYYLLPQNASSDY